VTVLVDREVKKEGSWFAFRYRREFRAAVLELLVLTKEGA
jgi:hypothetical protein